MPVEKPRVLAGTLRPVGRDLYDFRKAINPPSATGGAPNQKPSDSLAGALGEETVTTTGLPVAGPPREEVEQVRMAINRVRQRGASVLNTIPLFNRSLQEYTFNNEAIVAETKAYLDSLVAQGKDVTGDVFRDTDEMARWAVATIIRSFEPGKAPPVPDLIYQSRQGKRVAAALERLRGAFNAGA